MGSLSDSPGAYHGIAEGHAWLPADERLALALKACDLYLAHITRIEGAMAAIYPRAEALAREFEALGEAIKALNAAVDGGNDAD